MARQKNIKFVGTQDNIIYYKWKEVFSMRTKPVSVKQTKATKVSASVFGTASGLGAALRKAFAPLLPNAKDKKMQLQFQTALQNFLQQNKSNNIAAETAAIQLQGFRFNEKADAYGFLQKFVAINSIENNTIHAELKTFNPIQQLPAPKDSSSVTVLLAAASFNPNTGKITDQNFIHQEIIYTSTVDAKQLPIPLQREKDDFIIIAAAIQFNKIENNLPQPVKQLRYLSAMVLGIWVTN